MLENLPPNFAVWAALVGVTIVLSVVCIFLAYKVLHYRNVHKAHLEIRKQGILEDLELATSDQLLGELRKRPALPYLMLFPLEGEDHKGLSIEVHNIPPVPCMQMLHVAAALTLQELKKRGVDIPDFPSTEDGEEWKKAE